MHRRLLSIVPALLFAAFISSCGNKVQAEPTWDHIVVVWEENKSYAEVADLPYMSELRAAGRTMTQSFGVARPSQPNYIAFFAGSTLGVTDNADHDFALEPNLYTRFADAGLAVFSYAQTLPVAGYRGSTYLKYARKHNPAASFASVPDSAILPFSDFPTDFTQLPQLSIVIPDLDYDMHDGSPAQGDTWLKDNLGAYAAWAATHRSLLVLTFDEPSTAAGVDLSTPILTILVGAGIGAGEVDSAHFDHYALSSYILDAFSLPRLTAR